jgi:trimethylamine--corrinoid protein Co-methyltransferase
LPAAIASGVTESKSLDVQAAYETAINMTQVAMSLPPIIYGVGSIESGLTFDHAKVVLDCEHIRHLQMAIQGIPVDEYHLAYDQIRDVGPGGTFLLRKETLDNMRKQSDVTVFNRSPRATWQEEGSPYALENAYQKAIEIIENYRSIPLPDGAEQSIAELANEFEAKLI